MEKQSDKKILKKIKELELKLENMKYGSAEWLELSEDIGELHAKLSQYQDIVKRLSKKED